MGIIKWKLLHKFIVDPINNYSTYNYWREKKKKVIVNNRIVYV